MILSEVICSSFPGCFFVDGIKYCWLLSRLIYLLGLAEIHIILGISRISFDIAGIDCTICIDKDIDQEMAIIASGTFVVVEGHYLLPSFISRLK